jgi:hypothetical protein
MRKKHRELVRSRDVGMDIDVAINGLLPRWYPRAFRAPHVAFSCHDSSAYHGNPFTHSQRAIADDVTMFLDQYNSFQLQQVDSRTDTLLCRD